MRIGIVSGYFNPLHLGHLEYIEAAKKQVDELIAIINNDYQVELKGSKKFMDELHRAKILSSLRNVDIAVISVDTDRTVCRSLEKLFDVYHENNELFFFNSGDRLGINTESEEVKLCARLGIKYVAIPLPKRYSSSQLKEQI